MDMKAFFDRRAGIPVPHRYNRVNYDTLGTPQSLVLQRDRIEKEIISGHLPFSPEDRVLDIGCGVGRWADEIVPKLDGGCYLGIDFSEKMLGIARERFKESTSVEFACGQLQDLPGLAAGRTFDVILINGVLEYVSDDDMRKCLVDADSLLSDGGFIYLKEPVSTKGRTVFSGYSDRLGMEYFAIYRSMKEYTDVITDLFLSGGYELIASGPSWNLSFDTERAVCNMFWVIRKGGASHEAFRG